MKISFISCLLIILLQISLCLSKDDSDQKPGATRLPQLLQHNHLQGCKRLVKVMKSGKGAGGGRGGSGGRGRGRGRGGSGSGGRRNAGGGSTVIHHRGEGRRRSRAPTLVPEIVSYALSFLLLV